MTPKRETEVEGSGAFRRIVFIDFDGVTHPAGGPAGQTLPFEWVPLLAEQLVAFPDVGVIVHSSWREQFSEDYLQDFLAPLGKQFAGAALAGRKDVAIEQYLLLHPEVEAAIILDDEPDQIGPVTGAVILGCDPQRGISCPAARHRLREWLERPPSPRPASSVRDELKRKRGTHEGE